MRSFQVAQVVYDITVRFCKRYIDRSSRTRDQMVQAARSGVQNIAEGSAASGASKKFELKLTQVARASLEELKLDYEDFLRQNGMQQWERNHPLRQKLVDSRPQSADEVAEWVKRQAQAVVERGQSGSKRSELSEQSRSCAPDHAKMETLFTLYAELSANAALTLTTVAGYLLDRHLQSLAHSFKEEGGFSERLYWVRSQYRREQTNQNRP